MQERNLTAPMQWTGSEMLIHEETRRHLHGVDLLIFDIDGVLVDASESFPNVVCETVQFYFERILHWPMNEKMLAPSDVVLFKRAGGFNSDEDLTHAVILYFLTKVICGWSRDVHVLRTTSPTLQEYTEEIARRGGGLLAAEAALLDAIDPDQRREITERIHPNVILQLFREIYGGTDWCERLYGFTPQYVKEPGYVRREKPILRAGLLANIPLRLTVLSGRTREETQLAIDQMGLQDRIPAEAMMTAEEGFLKPDPRCLLEIRHHMRFTRAVFIGDSLDDLRTVQAYRDLPGSGQHPVHSCLVLSGIGGTDNRQDFLQSGADIIAPDVNAFLTYFVQVRSSRKEKHERSRHHGSSHSHSPSQDK